LNAEPAKPAKKEELNHDEHEGIREGHEDRATGGRINLCALCELCVQIVVFFVFFVFLRVFVTGFDFTGA
jgi:hypothetical protein